MTCETQNRVRSGVPAGGQFCAAAHREGSVVLGGGPLPYPAGSRVRVGGRFGHVAVEPDHNGNMVITLDDGWTLRTKGYDVVPWDAYLASEMPPVEYNPYGDIQVIDQEVTDRFLRGALTRMRNGFPHDDPYMQGTAQANAEVAAALLDADADPETITGRSPWLLDESAEYRAAPSLPCGHGKSPGSSWRRP